MPGDITTAEIGRRLINGVREIDFASTRLVDGVECGVATLTFNFTATFRKVFANHLQGILKERTLSLFACERSAAVRLNCGRDIQENALGGG